MQGSRAATRRRGPAARDLEQLLATGRVFCHEEQPVQRGPQLHNRGENDKECPLGIAKVNRHGLDAKAARLDGVEEQAQQQPTTYPRRSLRVLADSAR
jgi:hypothetical protein